MKKLQYFIRDYFGFSQTESNGFIVLIVLMLALLITPILLKSFFIEPSYTDSTYQKDLALLNQTIANLAKEKQNADALQATDQEENSFTYQNINLSTENFKPFAFDPNQISVNQWKQLGLKPYLAERIEKYRSKGGKFKIKSDIQKIYGFPEDLYKRLYAYIELPENKEDKKFEKYKKEDEQVQKIEGERTENQPNTTYNRKTLQAFDINTADTAQLKQIRGIGAVLSERIVKFRNNVGGFHAVEQVKEVYGIKEEVFLELEKYAKMSKGFEVKKININTDDVNTLKSHPYIGYKNAQLIVNYRIQHGNYTSADDLLKIKVIEQAQVEKLRPYLAF
jgi:competence ComEA-like helix-hairpin-helix protein